MSTTRTVHDRTTSRPRSFAARVLHGDQVAYLLTELRVDRDRVAEELKATESHRVALEGQLESATGGLEQLRAAADRALALAREIAEADSQDTTANDGV